MTDIIALVIVVPLLIPTLVFITETALGAWPGPDSRAEIPSPAPHRVAILVPAHDEEAGVAAILKAQRAGMPGDMRLLVVADNCSDRTAVIARDAGAEVVERNDPARRGKGFALAFGRAHLAADPPLCVIVVDADTVAAPGALARLGERVISSGRPVQGAYVIEPRDGDSSIARFSAAAFFVKNVVRQRGISRLGAPALLTGSGMAFPWDVFVRLPLETGHIAEDLMLGVHCSLARRAPLFEQDARIVGTASSTKGTTIQRRRWESGFLQVASDNALPLIARAIGDGRPRLAWLGLHLLTPPLILLLVLDGGASLGLGILSLFGVIGIAFPVMAGATLLAVISVLTALAMHRRLDLLRDWASIPGYLVWKIGLSLKAVFRREKAWIRTDRE